MPVICCMGHIRSDMSLSLPHVSSFIFSFSLFLAFDCPNFPRNAKNCPQNVFAAFQQ